ncbi:MAG: malonic semialdehyde reductase [Parasphingorhabdus sp.]|uniref:malonic semialdehyde reductase n=1 Tax=Parasphingorhabdus sp. TaxID=2709688 RepID=UPI0032659373
MSTKTPVSDAALNQLFFDARSQNGYTDQPVSDEQIKQLFDVLQMGPTSMNCLPARFVFARTQEMKDKVAACAAPPNQDKISGAPVVVIIGMDMDFVEQLPKLFPHADMRGMYTGNDQLIADTAFRNSTLQGAYLIMAARALGLDCGPMSGFNPQAVDDVFWSETKVKTNFICTIGHGDPSKVFPRLPRYDFDEVCKLA